MRSAPSAGEDKKKSTSEAKAREGTKVHRSAGAVTETLKRLDGTGELTAEARRKLPVIWSAIVSYTTGMRNVLETLIPQLERKTEILKIFAIWNSESLEQIE